ncbi:MAG: glycoside hydrolase family 16 protein [Bacteroidota bacterium]|nr:glycoside hydrolase family 16 protein [Bacteroidota bacterium]MDP4215507.1 glycoside hydrolase family 16 protein [Bacteroidota bacterium]MDP4246324.1 glycoside hydrolase family 16 protein [Bacteroidota bacterium]MDP4253084.1 glycoside hydrolase family 16 protein [Bacteroidota bacterium]MDP4259811.1 glycoside hydrolase family 16 protein [Bacteroidota bacterium]
MIKASFILLLLAGSGVAAQTGRTVFFDDFSGPTLDLRKWSVRITGTSMGVVNDEQQAYVDSTATLYIVHGAEAEGAENGALVLQPRFSAGYMAPDGKKFDFLSGRIDTRGKMEFTYGEASARIKMTEGHGLWPAWWILGNGPWPKCGEIDVMENIGDRQWASAAMHGPGYSGNTPLTKRFFFPPENDITHWHVYAVDWTPDSLIFRYDDAVIYRVTKAMVAKYGPWSYDNAKYLILNFAIGGGYPAGVFGTKEPYFGLDASTVEAIKAGRCRMLVDWVKVVQK